VAPPVIDFLAEISGAKINTVQLSKKNDPESTAKMLLKRRSDGPEWLIVVEASMGVPIIPLDVFVFADNINKRFARSLRRFIGSSILGDRRWRFFLP
jgi:hypothetical protein